MTAPAQNAPRTDILVIHSQVVRGAVGGRIAGFALERLGHRVWFLPTVLLPWHPGQGRSHRHVADDATFAALVDDLIGADTLSGIGAVVSGYLGSPAQAREIVRLVAAVRKANPEALYVCDPVSGDRAGLYVSEETAAAMRDTLLPEADVATPNLFELEWMCQRTIATETEAIAAARALGPARVLVTSAPAMRRNSVSNLLVSDKAAIAAEHGAIADAPNGTGDLMAALFTANLLAGQSDEAALKRSAASVFELVARSVKRGSRDLLVAWEQAALVQPMALVSSRRVMDAPIRA
ncbi:pyridoxal kinase PdxY [Stappia stellulata]|uniref:pyridoxal kinase PdxY n=1 Tax=Stappia stellulata TaxID=71235 RepID=UPI000413B13A|nr:pyridoxal kinase PdxY [Stappia stellulata]